MNFSRLVPMIGNEKEIKSSFAIDKEKCNSIKLSGIMLEKKGMCSFKNGGQETPYFLFAVGLKDLGEKPNDTISSFFVFEVIALGNYAKGCRKFLTKGDRVIVEGYWGISSDLPREGIIAMRVCILGEGNKKIEFTDYESQE